MQPDRTRRWLQLVTAIVAVALLAQTGYVAVSLIPTQASAPPPSDRPIVPEFDYGPWRSLPVQTGRVEPLDTFAAEYVREITGRTRFEKQDPVAVMLAWWLTEGTGATGCVSWEHHPFILCEHGELRRAVFAHHGEAPIGRHVSPAVLRESPGFDQLLEKAARARAEHQEKAHLFLDTAALKAEEVGRRLARFDAMSGRSITRLHTNALAGEQYLNVHDLGGESDRETVLGQAMQRTPRDPNPLRLVILDPAPKTGWFSTTQVQRMHREPKRWDAVMQARFMATPHRYFAAEDIEELCRFQQSLQAGRGAAEIDALAVELARQREAKIAPFAAHVAAGKIAEANALIPRIVPPGQFDRLMSVRDRLRPRNPTPTAMGQALEAEMRAVLAEADDARLTRLRALVARSPFDDESAQRPLLLEYLEAKVPDLYRRTAAARAYPGEEMAAVLQVIDRLREAYAAGDAIRFDAASTEFFTTLQQRADAVGEPYPGVTTIPLELSFNRVQPFRWAWVAMLLAAFAFALRLGLQRRGAAVVGYLLASASLGLQLFGFYARVRIGGWAPVSNMYETIIFAAFMTFVFALVLETIYRKTIFILTGTLVSTLALILADNLPLDSSIGGLVPVLRSNFWLTVHVVTIVCGYAAGCLAWGVGNLTLGLLAFGRGDEGTLKMLSRFTYRALQLTVVLLATGTFLGGWWAAQAWGRFWGWDPKEVGALVALVCYVIPLHARYIGWVRDFGLAVSAVLCFGSILISWYVVNFVLAAGLHSYGFGGGGAAWVVWAVLGNLLWVLVCTLNYPSRLASEPVKTIAAAAQLAARWQ